MSRADDVAAAVLARTGEVTTWKFQKLVYYAQAWHLVRFGEPLFAEVIEAWKQGPVVRQLFNQHRTRSRVATWPSGDSSRLTGTQEEIVAWVVGKYGRLSADTLSEMTHAEAPWFLARGPLPLGARSDAPIDVNIMRSFYSRQEASPNTAVSQAMANSALEGVELGDDWERSLQDVAEGTISADELIRQEMARLRGA